MRYLIVLISYLICNQSFAALEGENWLLSGVVTYRILPKEAVASSSVLEKFESQALCEQVGKIHLEEFFRVAPTIKNAHPRDKYRFTHKKINFELTCRNLITDELKVLGKCEFPKYFVNKKGLYTADEWTAENSECLTWQQMVDIADQ